jgi:hypothetical protein
MAEISKYSFSYREVVEALVKHQGLSEGIWSLDINFGIQATNFGANETDLKPTAIIPVLAIGLTKQVKETNLTVDASKVNPARKIGPKHN